MEEKKNSNFSCSKKKSDQSDSSKELFRGVYLCHTGNKYRLLFIALDADDKSRELVVYQSLADKQIWVRPKDEFMSFKEKDGQSVKRFTLIQTENDYDWENRYKRALADYQNLIKQHQKEKEEFSKYVITDFLHDILPVYDHLRLSLRGLDEKETDNPWVAGVRHVLKNFQEVLSARGLEEIETNGQAFDHNTMEAVDGQGDKVKQEVSLGYKLNGRVIRPAKVIVE